MNFARDKWLGLGGLCILAGYLLLGLVRSTSLAPVLLVAGYCVFLPLHLWVRHRADHEVGE